MRMGPFQMSTTCNACGGAGSVITDPCPKCRGRGRVKATRNLEISVPPGAFTGYRMRIRGEGEAGDAGAPHGDLICEVHVKEHSLFRRQDEHLICQVPITFSQAALGGDIEVPTLDGPRTQTLKRGLQSGEAIAIPGQGMPNLRSGRRGDLVVQVIVETPRNLSERQEELLRELAELDHSNVSPQRKSFLDKIRDFFTAAADGEGQRRS